VKAAPTSIPPVADLAYAEAESIEASLRPRSRVTVALLMSFLRSQLVAGLATAVDFGVMVGLVEKLHVYYLLATALGAVSGGITAFVCNRHWSFLASHGRISRQALRYAIVWAGSITLNCVLVWAMTDGASLQYAWSKVLTAIAVGSCFNFPLHRWYVFR
jgi:putative flippase GtrA